MNFVGSLGKDKLVAHYQRLDVVVIPSLPTPNWLEQFCRVAVEAMACGVPIVASRSGALPEVVGDAGVLVPPNDPTSLAAALQKLASDPDHGYSCGRPGSSGLRDYAWDEVATQLRQLYAAAVSPTADSPTAELPPLEVAVVAYGSADLVEQCLAPLGNAFPVTILDNSSCSETRDIAARLGARYVDPGRNVGFAAGVNHALAHRWAPDSDVLLLNPDAAITADDVQELQRRLHRDPRLACVAPRQLDPRDGTEARVAWPFPSPSGAWAEAIGLGRLRTRSDFVIGSVLLLRGVAIDQVGGFDERFFLYAEETDWQYGATRAGWRVALVPEVTAEHVGAGTGGDPLRREVNFHASQELFVRKHHGRFGWQSYRLAMIAGSAVRSAVLRGARGEKARTRLRLYMVGPVHRQQDAA